MSADIHHNISVVKGDRDKAKDYRERLMPHLTEVCAILTEAGREGIVINYTTNSDAIGNHFVSLLKFHKDLDQ